MIYPKTFLILLPLVSGQFWDDCDIIPTSGCSCTDPEQPRVSCRDLDLTDITSLDFDSEDPVYSYDLSGNSFANFPSRSFASLNSYKLLLSNSQSPLVLHRDMFTGLPETTLRDLDLSGNQLVRIPTASLRPLSALTVLRLNNNNIRTLRARSFQGLDNLLHLHLLGNEFGKINKDALSGTLLDELAIQFNQNIIDPIDLVSTLKWQTIAGLRILDLSGSNVNRIQPESFRKFPSLVSLVLRNCGIDVETLSGVGAFDLINGSLINLNLEENTLVRVPKRSLRALKNLRVLDLRGNSIASLSSTDFKGLASLSTLLLDNNAITTVHSTFSATPNLHLLSLGENPVSFLAPIAPSVLRELQIRMDGQLRCDCSLAWLVRAIGRDVYENIPGPVRRSDLEHNIFCNDTNRLVYELYRDATYRGRCLINER